MWLFLVSLSVQRLEGQREKAKSQFTPPPLRSSSRCLRATPEAPVAAQITASLQGLHRGLAAMLTLGELPMRSQGSTWNIAGTGPGQLRKLVHLVCQQGHSLQLNVKDLYCN